MLVNNEGIEFNGQTNKIGRKTSLISNFIGLLKNSLRSLFNEETLNVKLVKDKDYRMDLFKITTPLSESLTEIRKLRQNILNSANFQTSNSKEMKEVLRAVNAQIDKLTKEINSLPSQIEALSQALSKINIPEIKFPQTQRIEGKVRVENPIDLSELKKISNKIDSTPIEKKLEDIYYAISKIKLPEIKFPKIDIPAPPNKVSFQESDKILKALERLEKTIEAIPSKMPEVEFPSTVNVGNFPPQKIPQPVTNININPLRGEIKTTAVTVGTTRVPLPGEVLAYRRGIVIFNNGSVTIYVGGANVTASDGMPILAGNYSPPFDAGPKMILYGITSSGSTDVRVAELSNENVGA